jgi:inner membrane protein
MSPITHFLIGWVVANADSGNRRERAVIAVAGVIPDVDGLGVIIDYLLQDKALTLWSKFHHVLAHNLSFGLLVAACTFWVTRRHWRTALLALLSFHLHLLGDLVGSRGPDGYQWPIPYFYPFATNLALSWQGQWELNAWPNFAVTGCALIITFYLAWKQGYSPLEMISPFADTKFIETLRRRF